MSEIPGYPIATIAKLLDLSERHVRKLSDEGVLIRPEGRGGRWPITNVTLYIRYLRERAFGANVSETDLHTEKIRIAKNTADKSVFSSKGWATRLWQKSPPPLLFIEPKVTL